MKSPQQINNVMNLSTAMKIVCIFLFIFFGLGTYLSGAFSDCVGPRCENNGSVFGLFLLASIFIILKKFNVGIKYTILSIAPFILWIESLYRMFYVYNDTAKYAIPKYAQTVLVLLPLGLFLAVIISGYFEYQYNKLKSEKK